MINNLITSNNQRLVKCIQSLVKVFLLYWLHRKKKSVSSAQGSQENIWTWDRGYLCHIARQSARPKWRPMPEIAWHHNQCPWDWSIKPLRVISVKTTPLVCVLLRRTRLPLFFSLFNQPINLLTTWGWQATQE